MPIGPFVTATYEVSTDNQARFVAVLKDAEDVMRAEGHITAWRAIRMRSKANPELILEVFQWVDDNAFGHAMKNPKVTAQWERMEGLWKSGGFGLNRFPEAAQPWAQFDALE